MSEIKFGNNYSSLKFGNNRKIVFFQERGSINDWRYSTAANGQIILMEYLGDYSNTVMVPENGPKYIVNKYTTGSTTTASNSPFYNNPNVKSVDLSQTAWVNNDMYEAFYNCQNLISVNNINQNVINMAETFRLCRNLNQNIQIPNSVTNMYETFYNCFNLNQNIQIPNSITNIVGTFSNCLSLNQNIQIPNSVTSMVNTFYSCINLNQNIQIPNSVTSMGSTFFGCDNLNQNIQIPDYVTNMNGTFFGCSNLQGTINILSNQITNAMTCFYFSSQPKNVYIPFKYSNGVNSATFNSFVTAGYLTADGTSTGQNGVTMFDIVAQGTPTYGGGEDDMPPEE